MKHSQQQIADHITKAGSVRTRKRRRTKNVVKTVWIHLPQVNPDKVRRLRRLYTKAVEYVFHILQQEKGVTEKQLYHRLRKDPRFTQLPAIMVDRAGREAAVWLFWRRRGSQITPGAFESWVEWAKERNLSLPELKSGETQLTIYEDYLKGWPGSKHGQWPQIAQKGMRFYISQHGALSVSIDRVAQKTPAIVGGSPGRLLRRALKREGALKYGCARLSLRNDSVFLAIPIFKPRTSHQPQSLRNPTFVGVDLGLKTLAAIVPLTADGRILPAKVVSGRQLQHQLGVLWRKRKACAKKRRAALIAKIDLKIRHVTEHWVHTTAKAVVDFATQFTNPVIVLEDLRNYVPFRLYTSWASPQLRDKLSKWARGKITNAVQTKAEWQGIRIILVEPSYSSHVCARGCCCLLTRNPKTGTKLPYFRVFRCPICGARIPRDVNAATEVARRGQEYYQRLTGK